MPADSQISGGDPIWTHLIRPLLFRLDPERSHRVAMTLLTAGMAVPPLRWLTEALCQSRDPRLRVSCWGLSFPNPVGLAAGFDKDARYFNALAALGFGFVEVGTLTARPQPGNPRPRIFRLPQDRALVNRLGFNNRGAEAVARDLARRRIRPILGINIGRSRATPNEEAAADYLASLEHLFPYAAYFALNVSSPNTPGLRELQEPERLEVLIGALQARNHELAAARGTPSRPVLLKLAPDLTEGELGAIVALSLRTGVSGLVATNTTVSREGLQTPPQELAAMGEGGLSGAPLTRRSREVVASLYRLSQGRLPVVGVGGILSGDDAWEMIRAGASLLQVYTGFVYRGPLFVRDLCRYLSRRLTQAGKDSISQVVGEAAGPPPAEVGY